MSSMVDGLPPPGRLNVEPPFKWGCNTTELGMIAPVALIGAMGVGIFIRLFTGLWAPAMFFIMFGTPIGIWLGGVILGDIKRDRPEGYYQQSAMRLALALRRRIPPLGVLPGLRDLDLIDHAGTWDLSG